jgi:hypothetical protein
MPLTEKEKQGIAETMKHWNGEWERREALPILFILMPVDARGSEVLIYKGGGYTDEQIKQLLQIAINSMPGSGIIKPMF